jgi:membrane-associated protease RseP (regulator of RpoE activity)
MLSGENLEVAWREFEKEIGLAVEFLELAELKEIRGEARRLRLLPMIRDEAGPIRKAIKEFADTLYSMSLPLLLVFCVSCLEKFLRRLWLLKFGSIDREMWRIFSDPKDLAKEIKRRYGIEIGEATFKARSVVAKRHIILHNNGVVDEKALEAFMEAGERDLKLNQKLRPSANEVRRDIEKLLEFARKVKEALESSQS